VNDADAGDELTPPAEEPLVLSADEATAVAEAAVAFAAAVPPGRDGPYRDLAVAADAGTVPPAQLATLERVCVLALETGKARQLGRAEAERLLNAVLRRTPRGKAMVSEVADVNRALAQLTGRQLEAAVLTWRMPGRYGLNLSVNGFDLMLAIEPDGLKVQHLQTG
jgi:hypothetical protein